MAHPPRIPVWLRWEQEVVYFITLNIAGRQRALANVPAYEAWKSAVSRLEEWTVMAGVMMPDHIHLLAFPHDRDADVGDFSGLVKRWMRQPARRDDWRWQPGSFDRVVAQRRICGEQMGLYPREPRAGGVCGKVARLALPDRLRGRSVGRAI